MYLLSSCTLHYVHYIMYTTLCTLHYVHYIMYTTHLTLLGFVILLTHCGRVTQICVFNAVKLGTSASSP